MASFVLFAACTAIAQRAHSAPYGEPLWSNTLDSGSTADDYERLADSQIRNNPVMLYTGSQCELSRTAKELLDTRYPSVRYKYMDYDTAPGGDWLMGPVMRRSGTARLPHIFICGRYVGGTDALESLHESGSLKSLLSQCGA